MFNRFKRWLNRITSPEGCTAVDARKLREYNHDLGIWNHQYELELCELAAAIHYPECWDTMTYPTLLDALMEIGCTAEHEDQSNDTNEFRGRKIMNKSNKRCTRKVHFLVIWLEHWVCSWLDTICGLISVVTFCAYRPWWDFKFRVWSSKMMLKLTTDNV